MEFQKGQQVVLLGVGVLRVESPVEPLALVGPEEDRYEVPPDLFSSKVRALSSIDQANRALARFGEAVCKIDRESRAKTYRRTHKAGDLNAMAETLAFIYSREETDFLDERYLDVLEKSIFEELSVVLEKPYSSLKRTARRAGKNSDECPRYLSAPDRKNELANASAFMDASILANTWIALDALYIEDEVVVGEHAQGLTLKAEPGVWFVYANSEDQDALSTLLAVHQSFSEGFDEFATKKPRKRLPIEGGCIALTDAWFAEDPDLRRDLGAGEMSIRGRCVNIALGGDGAARVRYREKDGRVIQIELEV